MHFVGGQRFNEVDVVQPVQLSVGRLLHHRGQVHRVNQLHLVLIGQGQPPQGSHDLLHGFAVVFPAVAGDHDHLFAFVVQPVQGLGGKFEIIAHRGAQRVDHRVSGDEHAPGDALRRQVAAVSLRGAEVQVRQPPHHGAVHLLREGGILVSRA